MTGRSPDWTAEYNDALDTLRAHYQIAGNRALFNERSQLRQQLRRDPDNARLTGRLVGVISILAGRGEIDLEELA